MGQAIVLESTSYPGTTKDILVDQLKKDFSIGEEIYVGFSSERINPGFNENTISEVPKVVSGYTKLFGYNIDVLFKCFYKNN